MKKIITTSILTLTVLFCATTINAQRDEFTQREKEHILKRDNYKCQCCGTKNGPMEVDHIIPCAMGGSGEISNGQTLCRTCNRSKSATCECKKHGKVFCNLPKKYNRPQTVKNKTDSKVSVQCSARTKKGSRCKNRTTNRNGRCHQHQ